ncbi:MAG: signal recognition particle protein, partial [Treponema sp.]|nr:signal recognition particle protein [Treponema sp.]
SGTSVAEVARLIKKFEKMRTMMKKMTKLNRNPASQSMMARMQPWFK